WLSPRRSSGESRSEGGEQDSAYGTLRRNTSSSRGRARPVAMYTVTGGAGFIGSHLVDELIRRGHHVRVVDDFSSGLRENLPAFGAVDIIDGDLADPLVARRAAHGAQVVLHQAAIPSVPRSVEDPARSHRANVEGTLQLLIAARDACVRRVVFAGSSSVYGN